MPKYTDERIKKALERCNNGSCIGCPFHCGSATCLADLQRAVLDLINRQEAEIERLERIRASLSKEVDCFSDIGKMYSEVKSEAIKEFAERLKGCIFERDDELIDNLVKEMVGENDG